MPLIEPSHVALPKGQCFALIEGGNLWKICMLPAPDPDEAMPKDLQELAGYMRQHYVEAGDCGKTRACLACRTAHCRPIWSMTSSR